MSEKSPFTVLVTRNGMGNGDPELQQKLIKKYFQLLNESNYLPSVIAFYTDGVKLLTAGSPAIAEIKALDDKGVRVIACGTCLDYYGLDGQLEVGLPGGMTDIIEAQWRAEKVITI